MLVVGIVHAKGTSKRSGEPYDAYVYHCLARSGNTVDGLVTTNVWVSPSEYQHDHIEVGDQIRAFREGGVMKIENASLDLRLLADVI